MKNSGFGILLADILIGIAILIAIAAIFQTRTEKIKETGTYIESEKDRETPSMRKKVALTFDDGPDPEYTPKLLDGLNERNVKATFFLLGKQIEQYPDIVKRMYEEGHTIGCHSFEHVNFSEISEEEACEQVYKTCAMIADITGQPVDFVRPPYGEWLPCLDKDFCMVPVLWDVDPLDWSVHNADIVTERILKAVEENSIILLHDASESSVQAAFSVVDELTEEGYEFVTVDEILFD